MLHVPQSTSIAWRFSMECIVIKKDKQKHKSEYNFKSMRSQWCINYTCQFYVLYWCYINLHVIQHVEVFHGMHCHNLANQSRDRNPRKPFPSLYLPHNLIFAPISPYESHAPDHTLDLLGQFSINAHFISYVKPYTTAPRGQHFFGMKQFSRYCNCKVIVKQLHDSETIEVL